MRSRLAIWSWILTIIGIVLYPGIQIIEAIINILRCGYPIFAGNMCASNLFTGPFGILLLFLMLISALSGLIFGIVALTRSKNSNLTGKTHAIVGIILNILLFLYGIFALVGGLFGG